MAPFPQDRRMRRERAEDHLWSRWPAFAAALLIAALFGLLSGVVRDAQFPRGIQSAEKGSDAPHLSKREPTRALAAADRKDSTGSHAMQGSGALLPNSVGLLFPASVAAAQIFSPANLLALGYWPSPLPRAPPVQA